MITPKFKLSQTDSEVTVKIYAPFARLPETEINIEENSFLFYSSPYYLRLNLPGKLIDSEKEFHKVKFDSDSGSFTVTCMKQTFGETFNGLDMLTDLLTPKGSENINKPQIEVISGEGLQEEDEDEDLNWFYEQSIPEDETTTGFKYGFANSQSNVFSSLRSEFYSLVDISDPDQTPTSERKKERQQKEKEQFDDEHYLADLYEKETVAPVLEFEPQFHKQDIGKIEYSPEDEDSLMKLPRKEILIDQGCKTITYLGMVDILFAWCYNHRVTMGENCAESAWNIKKISCTLSWLDTFSSLKDVARNVMRRSLVFPLVRNWELSNLVLQDTVKILSLGKKQALKCFLEINRIFNLYEPYYILNQLYITDYCVWIQTVKDQRLLSLSESLKKVSLKKEDMNLELLELERAAEIVIEEEEITRRRKDEEENLNNVVNSLDQLSVIENVFAVSGDDNNGEAILPPVQSVVVQGIANDSSDDSSDDDSSDSEDDSDSSDSDSDDDDDSDSDSSSGTSSLDSDDEDFPSDEPIISP